MTLIDRQLQETLGELVLLRNQGEKTALFKALGTGADWALGKGFRTLKPAAKGVGRGLGHAYRKGMNLAAEVGGVSGISKEQKLLKLMQARRGMGPAWDTVRDLAKARGLKSPVSAIGALTAPLSTLTGRTTESGYARWLLGELKDPVRRTQFLTNATPQQAAAVKKLEPYFAQAHRAGEMSVAGKFGVPAAMLGYVGYGIATGDDPAQRPTIISPHRGLAPRAPEPTGMFSGFWGDKDKS